MQKPYKRDCYHRFDLREISYRVILVANHLAVGIGIARYTVESIVGSCDRAVTVGDCQYVAVCVVSVAYSAFGGSIARNSAHRVIEDLADLTARVGDLLADVLLVVFVALSAARNGGLGCKSAHIVVGVLGSTAERTGKTGYIAEQIVGCRACIVGGIANSRILTAR